MRSVFPSEDESRLLSEYLGPQPGTFVDVGANEPVVGSQSHALERSGWSGVLVEPLPHLAQRMRRERKAPVFSLPAVHTNAMGRVRSFTFPVPILPCGPN